MAAESGFLLCDRLSGVVAAGVSIAVGLAGSPGSGRMEMGGRVRHSGTPLDCLGRVACGLGALTWVTRRARTRGGQNAALTRRDMENAQVSGYSDG